jgi:predicted nucleic acid-binding protein
MIVADAGLIAHFAIPAAQSVLAEAVCAADPAWAAPLLWRSELRGTLVEYVRRRGMSFDLAVAAFRLAEEVIAGREYTVDSRKVLELAAASPCSAYDCEYVALAQDLGVPLVTADKRILRAFPGTAVALEDFPRHS